MERSLDGRWLCKIYLLWSMAWTSVLFGCVLCLNEEGQVLFKWRQDFLEDADNSLSNWNASHNTPCLWNGVKCIQGSVTVLDFSPLPFCNLVGNIHALTPSKFVNLTILNVGNTSLSGNFPEDIVNCSKLVYLNTSWSFIGGKFPDNFSKLQHLQVLDLTNGQFKGIMENKFDELQELRVLRLASNYFIGAMPDSILSLTKLEELTLSHNNWNGTLLSGFFTIQNLKVLWLGSDLDLVDMVPWPNVSLWESLEDLRLHGVNFPPSLFPIGLLTLTKLKTLHLERCHIMGPIPSLDSLTHLEGLNLGNNSFSGRIPNMFGSMPNMAVLWLYWNELTGPLPTSLLQCSKLWQVIVFSNGLSGDIASLANLRGSLTWLDIGGNNFSGEIPASLGNLTLLTYLNLDSNNLSGQIPPILESLPLLTSLDLSGNNLSGPIPPIITNLDRLSELRLYRNKLTGEIPYDLGRNTLLQWVDLGHNLLEGLVPPFLCWGNNVTLQFLGLYENKLTGTIPQTYGNCTNLRVLRLDGNQLEGPMPLGLWGGVNMVRMQLNGNHLSGSMDASIINAKSLSILFVQDNQFSGPIPAGIGQTGLVKFQANFNKFNGTLTPLLGNLSSLTQLVLGANSFHGVIPASLGNCSELFQLDISRNHLDGAIPNELTHLNKLSVLDVSENDFTGSIPIGLFNMVNLQTLNVAFNNLSGVIPKEGNGAAFVIVNFTGNPQLCMEGSCGSNSSTQDFASNGGRKKSWMVLIGVFGVLALVVIVVVVLFFKSFVSCASQRNILNLHEEESSWTLTSFHNKIYHENEVTALKKENLIGTGSSGQVYKVTLNDGEMVAVKKLWNVIKEKQCDYGFGTELKTLANIRHRHIVKLLCSCTKGNNNLLVYEYIPNGSLGNLLHGPNANLVPWEIRYKIAMGSARGLEYLHHDCFPQILHRDVKSNNILVDSDYEAHLADFGIAKMMDPSTSIDLSSIVGSMGYIPPEYSFGTRVTEKVDIYSFGVVLMELVTGKHATDPLKGVDGANLVQWVQNKLLTSKGLYEILDSKCGTSSRSEMVQVLQVGMLCTNYKPTSRPSMREVVKMLKDVTS